jgi:isopenicillin N synthase-like dioxygenase
MSGSKDTPASPFTPAERHQILRYFFSYNLNSDFGTITILYSQSVAALQILTKENTWKWVKHIDNAIVRLKNILFYIFVSKSDFQVVNAGDAMEFLSGGFYPATIHRFVMPYISSNPK